MPSISPWCLASPPLFSLKLCQLLPPALNMNTCWNLTRLYTQCFSLFCPKSSSGYLIPSANIFFQIQCPYKTSSYFYCVANFVLSLSYSQSPNACCYVFLLWGCFLVLGFFFWPIFLSIFSFSNLKCTIIELTT